MNGQYYYDMCFTLIFLGRLSNLASLEKLGNLSSLLSKIELIISLNRINNWKENFFFTNFRLYFELTKLSRSNFVLYVFNRPFVKITNLCIPYNLLNIPHMREIKYLISLTPSVGDFDEWAIKLKITTYLGDYSLG